MDGCNCKKRWKIEMSGRERMNAEGEWAALVRKRPIASREWLYWLSRYQSGEVRIFIVRDSTEELDGIINAQRG